MSKIFLMRWNPAISSYKLDVYHHNCEDFPDGFCIDWSVWDYQKTHTGDCFEMMPVGEYKPGIVFYGVFNSDPYQDEDWAGTNKKRYYVLMECLGFNPEDDPIITDEELGCQITEVDWMHGHSGVVLGEKESQRLIGLLKSKVNNFSFQPRVTCVDNSFYGSERLQDILEKFHNYHPFIHSKNDKGYDWLESDEDWSRCLVIPNPSEGKYDIEIETQGEFILYFAGSHSHYENNEESYQVMIEDVEEIIKNRRCAYSCKYENWCWCVGMAKLQPSIDEVKEFLKEDDEYFIRMLAEHTEKPVKKDGVLSIELSFFDSTFNKRFSFRLEELSDKVEEYRMRQEKVIVQSRL